MKVHLRLGANSVRWCLAMVILITGVAVAQEDAFRIGGNHLATYWGGHYYFTDAQQMHSNVCYVDGGVVGSADSVKAALDSAGHLGLSVILSSANVGRGISVGDSAESHWWPFVLTTMSAGRTRQYEAESILHDPSDIGADVPDVHAINHRAWAIGREEGRFQQAAVSTWNWGAIMPYTVHFRLRADTLGAGGPTTPVCSLVVVARTYDYDSTPPAIRESVVAVKVLTCDSFPDREAYRVFSLTYYKRARDTVAHRFEIRSLGTADSVWSDRVELFDMYADGLQNWPFGFRTEVQLVAQEYNVKSATFRYMLKDEPEADMFASCAAVCRAIEAAPPHDRTGITWVNWHGNELTRYDDYVAAVDPMEMWADMYPLMGRTWPNTVGPEPPPSGSERTPIDHGDTFQRRLDLMCDSALALSRAATKASGKPLWVDVQAFGEYQCDDRFHYSEAWDAISEPQTPAPDYEGVWREPSPRELRCMVWLSLAYGAKGITYWLFPTVPGSWPPDDPQKWFYLVGLLGWEGDSTEGYPGGHRPVFNTVQALDSVLTKIAPTLLNLETDAVGKWRGTPIDIVVGATADSVHPLHFGTFTGTDGKYFIVVNRHCLPSDTMHDTLTLAQSSLLSPNFLFDQVTGEVIPPIEGSGPYHYRYAVTLEPGQGRLFRVAPAWEQMASLPLGVRNRRVKDGGSLAGASDSTGDYVYALKGNNTSEFYRYSIGEDAWAARESIPGAAKRVKRGAALAATTDGRLFALKGNNTREFWRYDPGRTGNKWQEMDSVPLGSSAKPVKEGAGLAAVRIGSSDYVYMLKGSNTREFFRYDVQNNSWSTMTSLPAGPFGKNFKNGSCLAYDGVDTIYTLKGTTNEFYAYSVSSGSWLTRDTIPRLGASGRKRPAHYGTSLACQSGRVYALKGSNTNDFFVYHPDKDTWEFAPSLLLAGNKGVKDGGALAAFGGQLWALRGNNTSDFLRPSPGIGFGIPAGQGASSPGANEVQIASCANATAMTPRWSPGGSWIVFGRTDQDQFVQLHKAPANGGQTTALTSVSGDCSNPVWSPDCSTIAFEYESDASEYAQIAIVDSGGGEVTVLTSDACDHENPSWGLDGSGLYYSRLGATGYTQVYYVSSSGGLEQAKSSSAYDHEMPGALSSTEVVCQRDGDDVYSGIYRLNVSTGQEVALTSGSADYSNPSVAMGARLVACEKTDQDGYSQIVVFSADGGTETVVTSGNYDFESPSICYDGSVVSCVRTGSSGSAVCVIDLLEGTCQTFTDALADRETPDAHALSSAQNLVSTAYIREGDVYRVDYLASSGLVVSPNGFRAGIARDPDGYVHSVYSDGSLIRHRVQDQSGTCIRQDTPGYGDSPSLSMSIAGDAVVVSRKGDSIFGAVQRANNSWKRVLLYSAPAYHQVGPPSSAAFHALSGRFINACVPCYDTSLGSSMILFLQADTVGSVVLDTLDLCTGSCADSSVCMAVNSATYAIEAAYQRSESVFYRSLDFSPTDSMRPIPWTGPSKVNDSATTGRHPVCERRNGRFYVALTEQWIDSASSNPVWSIVRASCCDTVPTVTWEGRGPVSSVDIARKDYASLSLTHTAWAESSSTLNRWLIKANIADSQVTLSPDTSCVSCALLSDSTVLARPATAMTQLRLVWLQKYGSSGDTWMVPNIEREIYDAGADANVTRYNQGRKLCLDSTGSSTDSIRVVFRSNQSSLWLARKKDGDETWTSSLLRNSGDMPAIDQSQGRIWVCDRDVSTVPPGNVIRCQNRAIGSTTWHDFQVYFTANPNPANSRLGPPAIVASLNDTAGQNRGAAYVIFTAYTPSPPKSAVVICKVDTGGVVWTDTLHSVSSLTDSFADVAAHPVAEQGYGLHATWGQGGTIQYRKTTNLDQPEFTLKRLWSPSYSVSTATTLRHSVLAASAETVLVAFVAGDSGRILTRGQAPSSNYNVWDDTVNVSQCPDTVADWPSIAPLAPGESTVVSYQKRLSSTNYDVMARVNFHGSLNLSNTPTANSKYPHVAFHLHNDSSPVVTAIWTEEQSTTTAEVGYKRWQLGLDGGGGIQDYSIFDPNIHPALFAPAPNPFYGLARIHFQTNIRGMTKVSVMDITGRRVRNLLCMPMKPGVYNLTWNSRDDRERRLAGGVYFVRLETPNYHETRKVIMTE